MRFLFYICFVLTLFSHVSFAFLDLSSNPFFVESEKSFLDGYPPRVDDYYMNVVIEIPAGTTAKWKVQKPGGTLQWEFKKGKPRVVNYLPYPGNYGMIPQTLIPKSEGGDNDPLDVIVLCDSVPRGTVLPVRIIGVLYLVDHGKQDHKLIGISPQSSLSSIDSIKKLNSEYPTILPIIQTWFLNHKGVSRKMKSHGFGDQDAAEKIIRQAEQSYKNHKKLNLPKLLD